MGLYYIYALQQVNYKFAFFSIMIYFIDNENIVFSPSPEKSRTTTQTPVRAVRR
jgi:hypothetical protein